MINLKLKSSKRVVEQDKELLNMYYSGKLEIRALKKKMEKSNDTVFNCNNAEFERWVKGLGYYK